LEYQIHFPFEDDILTLLHAEPYLLLKAPAKF